MEVQNFLGIGPLRFGSSLADYQYLKWHIWSKQFQRVVNVLRNGGKSSSKQINAHLTHAVFVQSQLFDFVDFDFVGNFSQRILNIPSFQRSDLEFHQLGALSSLRGQILNSFIRNFRKFTNFQVKNSKFSPKNDVYTHFCHFSSFFSRFHLSLVCMTHPSRFPNPLVPFFWNLETLDPQNFLKLRYAIN